MLKQTSNRIYFDITSALCRCLIIIITFMSSERAGMLESNVGILRAEWKGTDNRIEVVCFGTAFAISPHIIITCAHSIYLERQARPCSSFTFVPGIAKGKVTSTSMIYKCTPVNFLQFQPLREGQNFIRQPIEQDIALLFLQRSLSLTAYPRVGIEDQALIDKDNEVSITGYPSQQFLKCANIFDASFQRVALKGKILEIDGSIIYHNLNTSLGHSGSPILAYNIHQEPVILGIHTHKGSSRNSGVFLTTKILQRLIQYQINFALQHERYKLAIKFPPKLRKQALEQLDTSTIEKILSFQSYCDQSIDSQQQIEQASIKAEEKSDGSGRKSDEMNFQIGRIDILLAMNQKCLTQLKDGSLLNHIIDCYLRISDLMLSQLRCLLNDKLAGQGMYPPQYASLFQSVQEGLQRELRQFRSLGQQLQVRKISSVQDHMRKLDDCEQMKQTRGEVVQREFYHDYDEWSEQYLHIITWPAQNSIQSMQQDWRQQSQDFSEERNRPNQLIMQMQPSQCFFLDINIIPPSSMIRTDQSFCQIIPALMQQIYTPPITKTNPNFQQVTQEQSDYRYYLFMSKNRFTRQSNRFLY